jgi:hypothetical protein
MGNLRIAALAAAVLISASGEFVTAHAQRGDEIPEALQRRNADFLSTVDSRPPDPLIAFFPRTGVVTYRHTVYSDSGIAVSVAEIAASEVPASLKGPLLPVFTLQHHGQPIGRFVHQLKLRGQEWEYIGNFRFVPPGEDRCSAIYVQWREENGIWVISEFGDEGFRTDALPSWCC